MVAEKVDLEAARGFSARIVVAVLCGVEEAHIRGLHR